MADADLVFTGGPVLRGREPVRADVAVRGDRIVAVGADAARELTGPRTEVVDLAGGLLLPGFTDAHVHPVQGGLERMRCDLSEYESRPAYLDAIRSYAATHPELEWITGGGWAMAAFPGGTPRAADLDAIVPDRPVFLPNRDHHGAWANSEALRLAGIDAGTSDPPDGRIERDPQGRPTGTLHEGAMDLVGRLLPPPTYDDWMAALLDAQVYLHSLGITGWQDAIVGEYANIADVADVYLDAAADGRLTARVVGALWWDRERGDEQIRDLRARRDRLSNGRFRATSVKIMQDGVAENFTAAMTQPYFDATGRPTDNAGLSFVDPVALRGYVTALDAAGFQVHVHAIGDRAVRTRGPRRLRSGPRRERRERPAASHRPHPGDPPRRPRSLRGARCRRQHAGAVGGVRAADGRPHRAVPRRRAGGLAVSVRRSCRVRGRAVRRVGLAGVDP